MSQINDYIEDSQSSASSIITSNPLTSLGLMGAPIMMGIEYAKEMVKLPKNIITTVITALYRICIPPGPLAITTCPEGGANLVNLYHLMLFEEKTQLFIKKTTAFPEFYVNSEISGNNLASYYICAQAYFTAECSALWPKCFELAWYISNPPYTTDPTLMSIAMIDWLALVPGDQPPCFEVCAQVILTHLITF